MNVRQLKHRVIFRLGGPRPFADLHAYDPAFPRGSAQMTAWLDENVDGRSIRRVRLYRYSDSLFARLDCYTSPPMVTIRGVGMIEPGTWLPRGMPRRRHARLSAATYTAVVTNVTMPAFDLGAFTPRRVAARRAWCSFTDWLVPASALRMPTVLHPDGTDDPVGR